MLVRCTCVAGLDSDGLRVVVYDPECGYIIHRLEAEVASG